jgi:hypothetical protein
VRVERNELLVERWIMTGLRIIIIVLIVVRLLERKELLVAKKAPIVKI